MTQCEERHFYLQISQAQTLTGPFTAQWSIGWVSCLQPNGRGFLEWSPEHEITHNRVDCFAATKDEYRQLIARHHVIEAVLDVPVPWKTRLKSALGLCAPKHAHRVVFVIRAASRA